MRNRIYFLLIPFAIFLFIGSYHYGRLIAQQYKGEISEVEKQIEIPIVEPEPIPLEEVILSQMSNEEKAGQLFIFGINGNTALNPDNKQFLIDTKPGGIILFSKNITNENQLKKLISEIQSTNPNIPLFISIDQEGGVVSRLRWNDVLTKSQGSIKTPQEAYNIAKSRGDILKDVGINMNLAPVAEYSENNRSFIFYRTYSGKIDEVVQKVIYSVKGYEDSGVLAILKHFPGHGETTVDPHGTLPKINISKEQWDSYVMPFKKAITEGNVDGLMIGHILFPNISPQPATISKEIITNKLVNEIGYKGLVISDDMEMDALKNIDTPGNLAIPSIEAGMDMLIYTRYTKDDKYSQRVAYNSILNSINEGTLNIDEHILKILRVKMKYMDFIY